MSAANEEAVHLFLKEKLGFNRIYDLAAAAVEKLADDDASDLENILRRMRQHVSLYTKLAGV